MVPDDHRIAVAYRAFAKAQTDCQARAQSGEFTTGAEIAACFDKGLSSSKLEERIDAFRRDVASVGQGGSVACKAASNHLVSLIEDEKKTVQAMHADLVNLDSNSFGTHLSHTGVVSTAEGPAGEVLARACK